MEQLIICRHERGGVGLAQNWVCAPLGPSLN